MIKIAYTIFDIKAAVYKPPFLLLSDEQAMREFTDIFGQDNPISQHPEDYFLVRMGTFNDTNAEFKTEDRKTLLTGLEALALKNQEYQRQGNGPEPADVVDISAGGTQ